MRRYRSTANSGCQLVGRLAGLAGQPARAHDRVRQPAVAQRLLAAGAGSDHVARGRERLWATPRMAAATSPHA
jgi:hypothetical protein